MIHIKDDYYIDSDAYQFMLKKDMHRVDKEGRPVFDYLGYYATVEQALRVLFAVIRVNRILLPEDHTVSFRICSNGRCS